MEYDHIAINRAKCSRGQRAPFALHNIWQNNIAHSSELQMMYIARCNHTLFFIVRGLRTCGGYFAAAAAAAVVVDDDVNVEMLL